MSGGEDSIFVSTHLGQLIQSGDSVLGYNLKVISNADEDLLSCLNYVPPDVILVKKVSPQLKKEGKKSKSKSRSSRGRGSAAGNNDTDSVFTGTVNNDDDIETIAESDEDRELVADGFQFEDDVEMNPDHPEEFEIEEDVEISYETSEIKELNVNDDV